MSAQIWFLSDWHWRHDNMYTFTFLDADGVERTGYGPVPLEEVMVVADAMKAAAEAEK